MQYYYMSRVVRKLAFAYAKTKTQISFAVTAKLISAFVFASRIVQSLYFLNPKFQASSHLLWLYSPVCVGPGRKHRRLVFSERGSYHFDLIQLTDYELCIAANLVDPLSMTVSWEDIGGLQDIIEQIQDTVIFPFRRRDLFARSQLVQAPKGEIL